MQPVDFQAYRFPSPSRRENALLLGMANATPLSLLLWMAIAWMLT